MVSCSQSWPPSSLCHILRTPRRAPVPDPHCHGAAWLWDYDPMPWRQAPEQRRAQERRGGERHSSFFSFSFFVHLSKWEELEGLWGIHDYITFSYYKRNRSLLIKRQKVTNAGGEERKRNSCALRRQEITNAGLGVEEKETWYAVYWG